MIATRVVDSAFRSSLTRADGYREMLGFSAE
jgi:hypothetical protein